jgi:hypothetical protein
VIGHANGVITIDLVESLRVRLGEPYRTMLGHFRHEVGHYYQHVLVENGPGADRYLADSRDLFGDERKAALYPFEIPPPVVAKLGFVHRVIRETARSR